MTPARSEERDEADERLPRDIRTPGRADERRRDLGLGHAVGLGEGRGDRARVGLLELVGLHAHAVAADDRDVRVGLGHDATPRRRSRAAGVGVLDAGDLELRSAAELDAEVEAAASTGIEHREDDQHARDRVPLLAAADEVERALARVEVVAECGEPVGHQDSLPSLVAACRRSRSPCVLRSSGASAPPSSSTRPCSRAPRPACGTRRARGRRRPGRSGRGPTSGWPLEKNLVCASSCSIGWVNRITTMTSMIVVRPRV